MKEAFGADLSAWLLDPTRRSPSPEHLRRSHLGAYAYATLRPDSPGRGTLRPDYLAALTRHHRIKAELLPLLAAWAEAGIPAVLFKGFHLAEFVYPVPGARFHGDTDVLVRPEHAARATQMARELGWFADDVTEDLGMAYSHDVCTLHGPSGAACVDLHRWPIHCVYPWNRVQRRITAAVWSRSRERSWEGIRVHELAPVDALLVGLVLQRCWGSDRWRLKPHDPTDFRLLCEQGRVSQAELRRRARELGAERTLELFLDRCDIWRGVLDLEPPSSERLKSLDRAVFRERGPLGRPQRLLGHLPTLHRVTIAALRAIPTLRSLRSSLGGAGGVHDLLRSLTPENSHPCPGDVKRRWATVRGIRWAVRLLPGRNPQGDCLVRSLAVYAALRQQGWPVDFVSGVRRDPGGVVGHAWVELDGRVLAELGEPDNRSLYAINILYPGEARSRSAAESA